MNKIVHILGYYVCQKQVRTKNQKRMYFGTWLDKSGAYFDTVHFPSSVVKFPLRGRGCYLLKGKVVADFGFYSIEITYLEKLPYRNDNRYL